MLIAIRSTPADPAPFLAIAEEGACGGEPLITHSYILSEAASLIQRRLGLAPALDFLTPFAAGLQIQWVSEMDHRRAVEMLQQESRRGLSFVDCVSFVVMGVLAIDTAFAFDADFERAGLPVCTGRGSA